MRYYLLTVVVEVDQEKVTYQYITLNEVVFDRLGDEAIIEEVDTLKDSFDMSRADRTYVDCLQCSDVGRLGRYWVWYVYLLGVNQVPFSVIC